MVDPAHWEWPARSARSGAAAAVCGRRSRRVRAGVWARIPNAAVPVARQDLISSDAGQVA